MLRTTGWIRIALVLGIYLAVVFFSWDFVKQTDLQAVRQSTMIWQWLLAATLVELANRFLFAVAWVLLLAALVPRKFLQLRKLFGIFAMSWIARYLPGSGTWMLARVLLADNTGVRRRDLGVATATEAMIQIATLTLLGSVVMSAGGLLPSSIELDQWVLWAIVLGASLSLYPKFLSATSRTVARLLRRPKIAIKQPIPALRILQVALVFLATSVLSSCGVFFTALAIAPELGPHWLQVVFVATLSSLASILAFFAPAGLGVREAVLIFGLAPITGGSTAVLVAVLHRGMSLVWDLVFLLLTRMSNSDQK